MSVCAYTQAKTDNMRHLSSRDELKKMHKIYAHMMRLLPDFNHNIEKMKRTCDNPMSQVVGAVSYRPTLLYRTNLFIRFRKLPMQLVRTIPLHAKLMRSDICLRTLPIPMPHWIRLCNSTRLKLYVVSGILK